MAFPADPQTLRDRSDIPYEQRERIVTPDQFAGLRTRYDAIDGVVQVGVTASDDAALFLGPAPWVLPGRSVAAGDDWLVAARRTIEDLTELTPTVEEPLLVERTNFTLDAEGGDVVPADSVVFRASLPADADGFRADPEVASKVENPLVGPGATLEWFESLPDDPHPNHADYLALFLD